VGESVIDVMAGVGELLLVAVDMVLFIEGKKCFICKGYG